MAIKLQLDGKNIGEIDDKGFKGTVAPEAREQMKVPLFRGRAQEREEDDEDEDPKRKTRRNSDDEDTRGRRREDDDEDEDDDDEDEDDDDESKGKYRSAELKALRMENQRLMDALQSFTKDNSKSIPAALKRKIEDVINIQDPKDDPYGVARTIKGLVGAINDISERVDRMDQHHGWLEFQRALNAAKDDYPEIFKDRKAGKIASRLLDAEIRSNPQVGIETAVSKVAREIRKMGLVKKGKSKVEERVDRDKKLPRTLRGEDGTTPAITVNRPKNLAEAQDAYKAWRAGRDKALRG